MPKTPQQLAALNLADTFLAGRADFESLMQGAQWVFGRKWPWMSGLCKLLIKRTGEHFHEFSREELTALITSYKAYAVAWEAEPPPHVLRYCLTPAPAHARPDWVRALALPALGSVADLATWLNITPNELDWFAGKWRNDLPHPNPLRHYHYRWVKKHSGGLRLIEIPKIRLRAMQRQILQKMLNRVLPHDAAHGFSRGRSCLTHASAHSGKHVVMRMDIKDFFPSIPAGRVHALFAKLGYSYSVARLLAGLCTHITPGVVLSDRNVRQHLSFAERQPFRSTHLPQGAPTSPALANLCTFRLDMRLEALAHAMGARYTRYADDLTFSGDCDFSACIHRFHVQVAAIALEEGFVINTRKTRIMHAATRQQVTGLVVNQHPNLPRKKFDHLKAILTNCGRLGPVSQNRSAHPDFRAYLHGLVSYALMVNPHRGNLLQTLYQRIAWKE
jgi:RNA-directed DNA polymerase